MHGANARSDEEDHMTYLDERRARRTDKATVDLAACAVWAGQRGMHLMIDRHVERHFGFTDAQFPPDTVDARAMDSVALAIDDLSALLVTASLAPFWGTPITSDRHWRDYKRLGRTWAVLGVNALSGWYYYLSVGGGHNERFVTGVRAEPLRIDATVELADGTTTEIVRTTVDYTVEVRGRNFVCKDLRGALRAVDQPVVRIDSVVHDDVTLARAIEDAGQLPERLIVLNGRQWSRTPALVPGDPRDDRSAAPVT